MDHSKHDAQEEEDVFEQLQAPDEGVQNYTPGGLHPVHLGDTVGRYKILRKLGYGGYSTVWLGKDQKCDTFVALKIARADSDCTKEILSHQTLQSNFDQHPGISSIMALVDHFIVEGPNGKHTCLAYEVLGPSVAQVPDDCTGVDTTASLTLPSARKIIHQILLGLDLIHHAGLVHGDVYSANVLFTVKNLSYEPPSVLFQPPSQISAPVKRISGPPQQGDPLHLTLNWPLNHLLSPLGDVKLSDLGNSFLAHEPPDMPETPIEYRSPELISEAQISTAQDCWAFACLVDSQNDVHFLQLFSLLGPLPVWLKQSWLRYDMYFDENGQLQKFIVDDDISSWSSIADPQEDNFQSTTLDAEDANGPQRPVESLPDRPRNRPGKPQEFFDPDAYPFLITLRERRTHEDHGDPESYADFVALYPPLAQKWSLTKHPDMEVSESELVLDFLQSLLTYDPKQRPPTKKLLEHPWIRKYCVAENEPSGFTEGAVRALSNKRKRTLSAEGVE